MITLPKTNSSPLKIGRATKGNDRIPTIHFQVRAVSFREGMISSMDDTVDGMKRTKHIFPT